MQINFQKPKVGDKLFITGLLHNNPRQKIEETVTVYKIGTKYFYMREDISGLGSNWECPNYRYRCDTGQREDQFFGRWKPDGIQAYSSKEYYDVLVAKMQLAKEVESLAQFPRIVDFHKDTLGVIKQLLKDPEKTMQDIVGICLNDLSSNCHAKDHAEYVEYVLNGGTDSEDEWFIRQCK